MARKFSLDSKLMNVHLDDLSSLKLAVPQLLNKERLALACIHHQSHAIRNAAYSLLVCSRSSMRPFPVSTLVKLQEAIPLLYTEDDAKTRNDFLSYTKRLCIRLHDSTTKLRKLQDDGSSISISEDGTVAEGDHDIQAGLSETTEFVYWLFNYSVCELQPSASYQRRIVSLKVLTLMLKFDVFAATKVEPCMH